MPSFNFKDYGKIVRSYSGRGSVVDDGTPIRGSYRVVQYADGRILLEHKSTYQVFGAGAARLIDNATFQGTTDKGYTIEATGLVQTYSTYDLPFNRPGRPKRRPKAVQRFLCRTLTVRSQSPLQPSRVTFSLVNLDIGPWQLPLTIEDTDISIRPLDGAKELLRSVQATRGIDVTAEASMQLGSLDEMPDLQRKVENLCLLLSLARGTIVAWISFDVLDEHGELATTACYDRYTRGYQKLYLIAPGEHDSTKRFLDTAYPNLERCTTDWDIRKAIQSYVEAKSESDVMESRGLKLVVCMELVRSRYLENKGRTRILPRHIFDPVVPQLKSSFRDALRAAFPHIDDAKQGTEPSKFDLIKCHIEKGLNYYPFRRALGEMCREVKLYPNSKLRGNAISKYLFLRNNLVHRATYIGEDESELELEPGTARRRYAFLDEFVGKFLLAALGYETASIRPAIRTFIPEQND